MIRSIPFEFFAENQHMYFDIQRLAMLEKISGVTVGEMASGKNGAGSGLNFVIAACIVGLSHHNFKATPEDYAGMIEKYIDDGGSFMELESEVGRAIVASGIYGKRSADIVLGIKPSKKEEIPNAQQPVSE